MVAKARVGVFLGLGSNQGERLEHLRAGVQGLRDAGLGVLRTSSLYEGPYVGPGAPQPPYLNAVVLAETHLAPLALLRCTQSIERARGRRRHSHLQPRPLDIDVLLYGDGCVRHPALVVPHARLHERRFALEPLAELDALTTRAGLARCLDSLRSTQRLTRWVQAESDWSREPVGV